MVEQRRGPGKSWEGGPMRQTVNRRALTEGGRKRLQRVDIGQGKTAEEEGEKKESRLVHPERGSGRRKDKSGENRAGISLTSNLKFGL